MLSADYKLHPEPIRGECSRGVMSEEQDVELRKYGFKFSFQNVR